MFSPFSSFVANRTAHKKPNPTFIVSKESILIKTIVEIWSEDNRMD